MAVNINLEQPTIYENITPDILSINLDKFENKLYKLIPKVDHSSNWIGLVGIGITILFGIIAYFTTSVHPSWWVTLLMVSGVCTALVCTIILLQKGYNALTVEQMMEEFKDGCTITKPDGTKITYRKKRLPKNKKK